MSERRHSVLVGAFAVGALLIAVAAGLFFAGGGLGVEKRGIIMAFDGSLRGLNIGAPVALRGVTVGQVTGIELELNADRGDLTMLVEAEINPNSVNLVGGLDERELVSELVRRGLRAQLEMQSLLTGLLYVQLDFHPDSESRLADIDSGLMQIPTIPTELEQLRNSLQSVDYAGIAEDINRIAGGLDRLLNSSEMQALPGNFQRALVAVETASDDLSAALKENSGRLAQALEGGAATFAEVNRQLPAIMHSLDDSLGQLEATLVTMQGALSQVKDATGPGSPTRQQLAATLQELSLAARALRSLARSIEEHPEALLRGRQQ